MKVNELLDHASNETFLNEEVAKMLGIQEPFQTVKVHFLNNEIVAFQSMPVNVTIESVDGQFRKCYDVRTCPHKVTGSYKMEDYRESMKSWIVLSSRAGRRQLSRFVDWGGHESTFVGKQGGGAVARLGYLGGPGPPDRGNASSFTPHVVRTLFSTDSSSSL